MTVTGAFVRAWNEMNCRIGRLDAMIWRWQDHRRAVELDELASLAATSSDTSGPPAPASPVRKQTMTTGDRLRRRIMMNGRNYKMTAAMRAVLAAVVEAPEAQPAWGLPVCEGTGLGTGTVYPALDKLMRAGLIRDEWETPVPEGRPRRRFYHGSFDRAWYRANRLLDETREAS